MGLGFDPKLSITRSKEGRRHLARGGEGIKSAKAPAQPCFTRARDFATCFDRVKKLWADSSQGRCWMWLRAVYIHHSRVARPSYWLVEGSVELGRQTATTDA